jgi:GAF domain-containing protein/multidrug resistance efflux pump
MPRSELERLRLLQRLNRTFHASLELSELLPRVILETVAALEAEVGSLWLLDDAGRQLTCHKAPFTPELEGFTIPLGAGIVGSVVATRRPEIVADTATDRRFLFQVDRQTGFVTRSVVCAPLLIGGRCLGAIQILNSRSPGSLFQREDLEFLESIAGDAAQALENARLFAGAQRAEDLATLLRLARELTATLNTQELLENLVHSAVALTAADRAAVALLPASGLPLRISASAGTPDSALADRVHAVAHVSEELYVPDLAAEDAPLVPATEACRCLLVLPLRDADGAVGVLSMESSREEAFSPRQRELAAILAQQATVAIRNALLYNQVPLLNVGGRLRDLLRSPLVRPGKGEIAHKAVWRWRIGLVALVLAVGLVPWDYRVGAKFQFRPATRLEVTAQTAGAVRQVLVREGQPVQIGEVLAVLEDRDAEREWTETAARRDLARQALQWAQAAGDLSQYRQQLTALRREEATLALLARRRAAARIRSPLAGIVLTPRLEERVGELLRLGMPFCQVGALDPLEAEIRVPEDRVPEVMPGQPVLLKLTALPGQRFRTRVTRVGAVAQTGPGGTYFPVVCAIANAGGRFLPGQEGWAKISLGQRPLAYVLLKRAWDWARLGWWRLW